MSVCFYYKECNSRNDKLQSWACSKLREEKDCHPTNFTILPDCAPHWGQFPGHRAPGYSFGQPSQD